MNANESRIGVPIIPGRLYRGAGGIYKLLGFAKDIPTYAVKVIVHGVDGRDKGVLLSYSPAIFVIRYELIEDDK